MGNPMRALGRASVRFRYLVVAVWIVGTGLAIHFLPTISDVEKTSNGAFLPSSAPSIQAANLAAPFQPVNAATATLVASAKSGPLTTSDQKVVAGTEAAVRKVPKVDRVVDLGLSKNGKALESLLLLDVSPAGDPQADDAVYRIRSLLEKNTEGTNVGLYLTGGVATTVDQADASSHSQELTETFSGLLILLLLLATYRAPLATLVNLFPPLLVLGLSAPVIAESSRIGVSVSSITQAMLTVLVLGAGTDYGLFLILRFREELRGGRTPRDAVVEAMAQVGESISFAALTVIGALLCLLVATFSLYSGLGPGLAIGIGLMALAALTLLPALLAIFGRAVLWPQRLEGGKESKVGIWERVGDHVIRRPGVLLVAGLLFFGGLTAGVVGVATAGFGNVGGGPSGSQSEQGYEILKNNFPASALNPTSVLMVFPRSILTNEAPVKRAETELKKAGPFSVVTGPFDVPKASAEQYVSKDGKTVQFQTALAAGDPGTTAALNTVPAMRKAVTRIARQAGAVESGVAGIAPLSYDINKIADDDLLTILPIVLGVIAILLALLVRSLVAPLYLILSVLLSYGAALGLAAIIFVHFAGASGINFVLPFLLFVFLMALGEDYNIVMMARIREEAATVPLREAIQRALHATGTTITSAGVILAGTFAVSGILGSTSQLRQIGWAIALGVLMDTFLVRTLLVPSTALLLGRWNWWPSKLGRQAG
jgi:RND superfamily putative drug exporter